MPFFRKKPICVEMRQFDGTNGAALIQWARERNREAVVSHVCDDDGKYVALDIGTLEGIMGLTAGNWLVCGVKNEFYPIDDAIKAETYYDVTTEGHEMRVQVVAEMLWQALNRQWVDGEDQDSLLAEIMKTEGPAVFAAASNLVRIRMHHEIDDTNEC